VEQIIFAEVDGWAPDGWPANEVVAPPPGDDEEDDEPQPATARPTATATARSGSLVTLPPYDAIACAPPRQAQALALRH
jgi:hypothetical protein